MHMGHVIGEAEAPAPVDIPLGDGVIAPPDAPERHDDATDEPSEQVPERVAPRVTRHVHGAA